MRRPIQTLAVFGLFLTLILTVAACAPATPLGTSTPLPTQTSLPTATPLPIQKIFAPYMDVSFGVSSPMMDLANNGAGNKHYTLAFILGRDCLAAWSGIYKLDSSGGIVIGKRINELRSAGGDVIVSFGGAAGPELANTCPSVAALQEQYQAVVTRYNLKTIDLDVEEFSPEAIDKRNKALKALAAANPNLKIQYTLGVAESGFTERQIAVLSNAKSNDTPIDLVNIMTMDYGHPVADMYAAAVSSTQAARRQLDELGFANTQLGITPMIGVNDTPEETFTLENATALVTWASENDIAHLAFWSMPRDNGNCAGRTSAAPGCSGIEQTSFQFSSIFQGFAP